MKPDTPDIDTLVADICAAHPELAGDVSALRAIVTELLTHQPTVTVDEAFKARLRASLLTKLHQQPKAKAVLPWWFIYTIPVGVTALLLLVVYPKLSTAPYQSLPPDVISPASDASVNMKMDSEAARDMGMTAMDDTELAAAVNTGTTDFFTATVSADRQSLTVAYALIGQPAFIVVTGPEGVVAKSGLLAPGEHTNLLIAVDQPLRSGTTYTATLYYDTGDGAFSADLDHPAYNQSGQPISQPVVAP